jgi:DNA-binding SARP family transcriptional activator/tetratricopeptide (TPR) repeat protein
MAGTGLRFGLLGSLTLTDDAGNRALAGGRQRALLAALLLSANMPVSGDALIEVVWDGSPPPGAAATLRSHVRRLRQALGPSARTQLTARDPGYVICVQPTDLDVLEFEAFCREVAAARRAGRWAEVSAAAAAALKLWRGPPLQDVPSQMLRDQSVPRLEQLRLQVLEDRIEANLRSGQHDRLVPQLRDLVAQDPLRERFSAQLMEALARAGRPAEALKVYRQARQALVRELGIEPSAELRLLHQRILTGGPALSVPPPVPAGTRQAGGHSPAPPQVPHQLPAAVRHFTGRKAALSRLTALLGAARPGHAGLAVAAVAGAPGVGKTALAVHWAHQVAGQFPDGQLHVDLRGFDPAGEIMPADAAIRGFLQALGVPADRVPATATARAGLYRSLLAGKRVLIVADNARDAGQVRPLLPGTPGCMVVATSRVRLIGLAAAEAALLINLNALSPGEASELLTLRIGADRARAEPVAVEDLARLCGWLPLALAVAAARAAARPDVPLATLAGELDRTTGRLGALETADPATDVRTVFSWSYQHLAQLPGRLFRLFGIHPGPDITVPAAAALLNVTKDAARAALDALAMASLADEHVPGRYACHDLLRFYASDQAARHEPRIQRRAAIGRLLDYYLHTAHAADRLLRPTRDPIVLSPPRPGAAAEQPASSSQAMAWFEAEHRNLLAAARHAAESGFSRHAWQLPWGMATFLTVRAHWDDLTATQRAALAAATALADHAAQALAHDKLGFSFLLRGHHDQADGHFGQALDLFQQAGDQAGQASTHLNVSFLLERQGRHAEAIQHDECALRLFQAAGHRPGQARALNAVGWHLALVGDHHQALARCQQALALQRQLGDRLDEAGTWDSIGYIHHQLGQHTQAASCYQYALRLLAQANERYRTAIILGHLGDTRHATGDAQAARDAWTQALAILDDIQHHHFDGRAIRAKLAQNTESPPLRRTGEQQAASR